MNSKKSSRLRRARRARAKIRELKIHRLSVYKSAKHIYAQIISPAGDKTEVSASTKDKEFKAGKAYTGNVEAATKVGKLLAERAKAAGIERVAFDRSGFKYHGRIKALADAAREGGIEI